MKFKIRQLRTMAGTAPNLVDPGTTITDALIRAQKRGCSEEDLVAAIDAVEGAEADGEETSSMSVAVDGRQATVSLSARERAHALYSLGKGATAKQQLELLTKYATTKARSALKNAHVAGVTFGNG